MAKVGLPSGGCTTPSAAINARANVVLPAPSGPSSRTRSPGLSSAASSAARIFSRSSEQPSSVFNDGAFRVRGPDVSEGMADVLDDIRRGHAAMSEFLGRQIAGQAVQINPQERGLKRIHLLAKKP